MVREIVMMIREWPGTSITWSEICEAVAGRYRHRFSRQALEARPPIKNAYLEKRQELGNGSQGTNTTNKEVDHNLQVAQDKIAKLEREKQELKDTINSYHQVFVRHEYNAFRLGFGIDALNAAIPDKPGKKS
jgi:hypothetical protein